MPPHQFMQPSLGMRVVIPIPKRSMYQSSKVKYPNPTTERNIIRPSAYAPFPTTTPKGKNNHDYDKFHVNVNANRSSDSPAYEKVGGYHSWVQSEAKMFKNAIDPTLAIQVS